MTTATPRRSQTGNSSESARLVEQRIAAGQQQDVEVDVSERVDADLPVVDAEPESADQAALAQLRQRGNRSRPVTSRRHCAHAAPCVSRSMSWMKTMSSRETPSRCRLSSIERSVPLCE